MSAGGKASFNYVRCKYAETAIVQLDIPIANLNNTISLNALGALKCNSKTLDDYGDVYMTSFVFGLYKQLSDKLAEPTTRVLNVDINVAKNTLIICAYVTSKVSLIKRVIRIMTKLNLKSKAFFAANVSFLGGKRNNKKFDQCYNLMVGSWKPEISVYSRYNAKPPVVSAMKELAGKLIKPAKITGADTSALGKHDNIHESLKKHTGSPNDPYAVIQLLYLNSHRLNGIILDKLYINSQKDLDKKLSGNKELVRFSNKYKRVMDELDLYLQYKSLAFLPYNDVKRIKAKSAKAMEDAIKKFF